MRFYEYKHIVLADLNRIRGKSGLNSLIKELVIGESYKYIFWLRTCRYLKTKSILRYNIYAVSIILLNHYKYKFGIDIPVSAKIGAGLYIGHFSGIFINPGVVIGKNCNLSQGVTIGESSRGKNKGCATIGDNVYVGPGAKIVGNILIGDNVAVGANSVVTKSAPESSVLAGVPARIISSNGSDGYIINTDYWRNCANTVVNVESH